MSHLSQIKTRISNKKILQKTLNDLGFTYKIEKNNRFNMSVSIKNSNYFELLWDGKQYDLIADTEIWKHDNINIDVLINQITQKYSYNSIIQESIKYGFTNLTEEAMQDGSIRIVVHRWE